MAISFLDNLSIKKQAPDVQRQLFDTVADMVAWDVRYLPDVYECNVKSTGKRYRYNINNENDAALGKWREVTTGSGGSSNYNELENKPKINDIELSGNKTFEDLGIINQISNQINSEAADAFFEKRKVEETETDFSIKDVITENINAISVLNGTDEGSVSKTVADAISSSYHLKKEVVTVLPEIEEAKEDVLYLLVVDERFDTYMLLENERGIKELKKTGTSSNPGTELTRAEYDALTDEERANGTVYFITDEDEEIDSTDTVEPAYNDIPVIYLDGELPPTKATGYVDMMLRYVSRSKDFTSYASVKLQGNQPDSDIKKSLNLKFFKDATRETKLKVNFRGWGKESQFTLSSDWYDRTHARNVVSSKIFTNIVKTRADFDDYPELFRKSPKLCQYDGFLVKMYLNGVYQGFYSFRMKKEDYTYNMTKKNENHHMIQLHRYTMANLFREEGTITMETDDDGYGITEELQDEVSEAIQTRWNEVIDFVKDSTDDEFKANIEDYFYLSSLIDAYVFIISGAMIDNTCNNHMFITYDGQKFIYCTYDMDSSWGATYGNVAATTFPRESFGDLTGDRVGNLLFIRLCECFGEDIYNRYCELREGPLSSNNIINEFEKFCIASREQLDQDYSEDTADGAYTSMKTGTEFVQLRNWVAKRFGDYCDSYFASLV